jgi:hypothetical protein
MSHFLWIEDFDNSPKATASNVLGSLFDDSYFSEDKRQLRKNLKQHGVFIELSFQDGLSFIRQQLHKIDYVILDINLPAISEGDSINDEVLKLLTDFQAYQKQADEKEDEQLLTEKCKELREIAGFYLYTELVVELGFPKDHILFCSNHGEEVKSIKEAFESAKIALPPIYEKANPKVQQWVKTRYENPYSRLRRGIIEACRYIANLIENKEKDDVKYKDKEKQLTKDYLRFNDYIESEKEVSLEDMRDYLKVLENFLPLRKPVDKFTLYKLFIRTLTHEWEATEPKKIRGLAWIMKSNRNWITHNSTLFNALDETMVAYLFIMNMRIMFNFDETVQSYENILLSLFSKETLLATDLKVKTSNKVIPLSKAYLDLKNLVLDERQDKNKKVQDGFYFNELANNIQQSNSAFRNDKQLFSKLLYQMFWLTTSNPFISTGNRRNLLEIKFWDFNYSEKPYLFELARHIYSRSFS